MRPNTSARETVKRKERSGRIVDVDKECEGLRRGEKENPKKKEQQGLLSTWTLESGPTKVQDVK
jgi:hypothetical protein